jgi:hypothetical protein
MEPRGKSRAEPRPENGFAAAKLRFARASTRRPAAADPELAEIIGAS